MKPVLKFFLITYVVSWTFFIAAGLISSKLSLALNGPLTLVFLAGAIAPSLVAIWLTAESEGRTGLKALLNRTIAWQVSARWYLFAVSYFLIVKLGMAIVHRLATGTWPQFGEEPWFIIVLAIFISTPLQAGEEIGWRGYALPRLAERFGLPTASIVLGVIWACWHLPLFFIAGSDSAGESFPLYLLAVTALSVAMAWLYWRSNRSLLLTMLMHAAVNNTSGIVRGPVYADANPFTLPPPLTAWLTAGLLWIGAAYFLVQMRGATLRRTSSAENAGRSMATVLTSSE
jgi:hypothetical protein